MSEPLPVPHPERRVHIGRVAKVRGLRGDLRIVPLTWNPERFRELEAVWCEAPDRSVHRLHIKRLRMEPDAIFIRFREAPLRDLAEPFVGGHLFLDMSERAELPDDMYYHDDVIGCEVIDTRAGPLGTVTGVMSQSAHDVLEVRGPHGEVLVPVAGGMILELDLETRRVEVDLPDGLIEVTAGTGDREEKRRQRQEKILEQRASREESTGEDENTSGPETDA
jgi:16S rRNA processing protein RimM